MKIKRVLLAAVLLAISFTSYSQLSFNDALAKAKSEDKMIIVDVYTDWCGWCKKMDAEVYGNSDIMKLVEDHFIFVKLDAEGSESITYNGKKYTGESLAAYFEATGFPTTVFLEPDGKLIEFKYDSYKMKNIPGYFKADDFKKILKFFKNGKYKDSDLSKVV